jgi:hypothetical protein
MSETPTIATLLRLMEQARTDEAALIAGLSETERTAAGTTERWSAKDLVAHIAGWQAYVVALLEAALAGQAPQPAGNVQAFNDRLFTRWYDRPWDEVLDFAQAQRAQIAALLPRFSEADLTDPNRYPWRNGEPLARNVWIDVYWHPEIHLADHYAQHGNEAAASRLRAALSAETKL